MIKNYKQFINEDLRSKSIIAPKVFTIDNLKEAYPDLNIRITDFNVVIGGYLFLNEEFYETLEKDDINKGDIIFEDCKDIKLFKIDRFTKVSDFGVFGNGITNFSCSYCNNLKSLNGCPKEVTGMFNCSNCENLTSLEFAPKTVDGSFYCQGCENLTSLEFTPKEVSGNFNCSHCKKLTSLKFAPEKVSGNFDCSGCNPNFIKLTKAKYGKKVKDK